MELNGSRAWTYHGRLGVARRTAVGQGGAGRGRTGRQWAGSPRRQPSPWPSKASKTTVLNVSSEARTNEILYRPIGEQNPQLSIGLSAVYPRDHEGSSFLAADQCTVAFLFL